MLNVYNGNVTTDANGEASVTLPDYFAALNQDFRYQLTVIGQFAQAIVAQEIRNNQFTIKTDKPRVKVSWQVTGIRQDPWAVANRIAVEEEKAAEEKGCYLHPELWGQSEEARIHRSRQRENQLRRASQLVPEQLRQRVEQHLQALLRGDHVDREELPHTPSGRLPVFNTSITGSRIALNRVNRLARRAPRSSFDRRRRCISPARSAGRTGYSGWLPVSRP